MTLKSCKNQHACLYNTASQRTKQTRTDASYVNYGYDNYGQVQTALGYTSGGTPITSEQYGYAYAAAWNLLRLTNNGAVTTRSYNSLNQLPSPPYGDYTYDANGNLTAVGSRAFTYDDENQLVSVADTMYQKTAFTYDAKGRLRIRQEYSWINSMWSLTDTINYVYDGMLAIQMRGATISSYTRGLDLSLSLQGAGGIGGLLAQTASGAHSYYHSDGNGNITYLMKADQSLGASYRYDDAYGNVVTTSGTLSNPFRFSSKEWLPRISAYYYGYRFYYPAIQRWLNRDPIGERGGINLYGFINNSPITSADFDGRSSIEIALMAYVVWDYACFTVATSIASTAYPTNDKKKHCMSSCVYNRCKLLITPVETMLGGAIWELMPGTAEWKDLQADLYGILNSYNLTKSCKTICDECQIQ